VIVPFVACQPAQTQGGFRVLAPNLSHGCAAPLQQRDAMRSREALYTPKQQSRRAFDEAAEWGITTLGVDFDKCCLTSVAS
jgi:hypothetical protein